MTISWTKGDGSQRIVLMKEASAVDAFPSDNSFYNARDTFKLGAQIGTNNYVVYNGSGTSVTVYGLKKNTTYHIAIFEFNGGGSSFAYLTSGNLARANKKTEDITADFSINDSYQCLKGNAFAFTNNSSNSLGSAMTYNWNFGDNNTSTATNPTHSYVFGGIMKVELIAQSTGCKTSQVLRDTVLVPYITDFGLDKSFPKNDSIQCLVGNYFQLKNLSRVPLSPIYGTYDAANYFWVTSDGQSGNLFDVNFSFKQPGNVTVKLYTRRKVSAKGDFCVDSIQKSFVVLPIPLVPSHISISDTALCLNDNNFTFSHSAPNIATSVWRFGDGDSTNGASVQHKYKTSGKKFVSLRVVDVNGCNGLYNDSVEVFPQPNNFFVGLDTVYCLSNTKVVLKPNLGKGRFEGTNVNASDSSFLPNTVGTFDVKYIYALGNCRDTFTKTTKVYNTPNFSLGKDTFVCPNASVDVDPGISGVTFLWNDGLATGPRSISKAGTYSLKASDDKCTFSDTLVVTSLAPPSISLGKDTTLCGGQGINLSVTSPMSTYIWNDGYVSPNGKRRITESGFYEVTVNNPCGTATENVDVEILPFACEIFVPNAFSPNDDQLNEVFKPLGFFQFKEMYIFNEYGQMLFYTDQENTGWNGYIEGEKAPFGMYYFYIRYQLPENGTMAEKRMSGSVLLME
jgi:gliding motility-associated-like protein